MGFMSMMGKAASKMNPMNAPGMKKMTGAVPGMNKALNKVAPPGMGAKPPQAGGIGPSNLSNFGKLGAALGNKMGGGVPQGNMGMKPQMQSFNPGMQMGPKPMPPDIPPMSGEGMEPIPFNNPNGGVLGPMPGGVDSGMNIRPPAMPNGWTPNPPMGGGQGMGPSPQGMEQLLAKMRARNTGFSGRM